jgi:hypothetical protein
MKDNAEKILDKYLSKLLKEENGTNEFNAPQSTPSNPPISGIPSQPGAVGAEDKKEINKTLVDTNNAVQRLQTVAGQMRSPLLWQKGKTEFDTVEEQLPLQKALIINLAGIYYGIGRYFLVKSTKVTDKAAQNDLKQASGKAFFKAQQIEKFAASTFSSRG